MTSANDPTRPADAHAVQDGADSAADHGEQARRALPAHFREKSALTDTAGVSWEGRDYTVSPFPQDEGSTPAALAEALAAHRAGEDPHRKDLVAVLAATRLLVPIMAVATETGTTAHGLTGDNGADMAMVSITEPDGSRVLPVFTSVQALADWRRDARPVPVVAPQAAQAAVQEGCTSLLVDAATPADVGGPILLPRSVLWALAQGRDWIPPHEDPELADVLQRIAAASDEVTGLDARAGERSEVDLHLQLRPGLTAEQVRTVVEAVSARLGNEQLVAERISSLRMVLGS
ncbi:SseB family protein [Brachybacterium alimentarium]|uniref:SseB family protein n=1 Tax=Brachybacterium alimentarium TaxID=47845 RepID=UPI000DF305A6|nr:SseB family protein [Brachybacterium alimentarium]RCS65445.1 SseB family protein [Brachybacterium alimentarium]RCS84098.1 SseB family protein [Brachybacterium alimentarium]RCS86541.1 SseB family protein [Brachybacterium alimentarium]